MFRRNWEVKPKEGSRLLEAISGDVKLWHANADQFDSLRSRAEYWRKQGEAAVINIVEAQLVDGTLTALEAIADSADTQQVKEIVRSTVSTTALERMLELQGGREIEVAKTSKASLLVRSAGVMVERTVGDNIWVSRVTVKREAEPGEFLEGKVFSLSTDPVNGGRLELSNVWEIRAITGLVDPIDFKPRVDMNIAVRA